MNYPVDLESIEGNYPRSVVELVKWPIAEGKDRYGKFSIITGFEGQGGCFWCGKPFPSSNYARRYCPEKSHGDYISCSRFYNLFFWWSDASRWALRRYGYRCAFCGEEEKEVQLDRYHFRTNLEVHHIIPLEGSKRVVTPYNVWWNLLPLCVKCHKIVTKLLFEIKSGQTAENLDKFNLAKQTGQSFMQPFASVPILTKHTY